MLTRRARGMATAGLKKSAPVEKRGPVPAKVFLEWEAELQRARATHFLGATPAAQLTL